MQHSSTKSPADMLSQGESSTERLESLEDQIPRDEAKIELDEEDQNELNAHAWYILGLLGDVRMSKKLKSEVLKLHARFEEVLTWYKRN